jgi:SAM-dependent methyltransferase
MFAPRAWNTDGMGTGKRASGRGFDREHGVTTQALMLLSELQPHGRSQAYAHATHYEPVPVADFRAMMKLVPPDVLRASTFVDVGAGMGRAILLAAEYPFKQIVGIELAPALHEIARRNLAEARGLQQRCRDVRLIRADARRHRFPAGGLVLFLYNPFDGDALADVLDRVAQRRSAQREWLLYHTPVHAGRVLAHGYEEVAALPNAAVYRREDRSGVA